MHQTYMKQMKSEQITYIPTAVQYLMKSRLLLECDFNVSSLKIITVFKHPNDSFIILDTGTGAATTEGYFQEGM